ncbi:conserved hypothetical protein [Neospora caninum Liverpool]|uniref:Uncharacterized protein n=1 Tax=Neospora caninum (strain Liverpool) TaxID=572307 RepID=F0VHW7_NEOCL|nr:conserved hypothetical protein [Neospora caninum Liverpool]CBZ53328.1 conserved hypothetical protein [Neospora caninum Liverpool]CEL67314.1 TPA: hypothetical protein BN1204_031150 [Neospora caninum Liverpool]|eukprot:XP_003883360.1 conserved hypothetical protein [Neospora caninum Liverpool]
MASSDCLSFLLSNVLSASAPLSNCSEDDPLVVHSPAPVFQRRAYEEKFADREIDNRSTRVLKGCSFPGHFLILNLSDEEDLEDKLDGLVVSSCPSSSLSPARLRALKIHVLRSLLLNLNFLRPPLLPLILQPKWAVEHWLQTPEGRSRRQHSRSLLQPGKTDARLRNSNCIGSSAFPPLECVVLSLLSWRPLLFTSVEVGAAHALGIHPSAAETASAALLAGAVAGQKRRSSRDVRLSLCPDGERWYGRSSSRIQETNGSPVMATHHASEGARTRVPFTHEKEANDSGHRSLGVSCDTLPSAVHDILSSARIPGTCHKFPASLCPRVAVMRAIAYWYCLEQLQHPDPWPSSADADSGGDRWMRPGKPTPSDLLHDNSQAGSSGTPLSDAFWSAASPSTRLTLGARVSSLDGPGGAGGGGTSHEAGGVALEVSPVNDAASGGFSGGVCGAYDNKTGICEGRFRVRERNTPSCGSRLLSQLQDSFDSAMMAVLERQQESLVQLRDRQSTEMEEACGRREEQVAWETSGCSTNDSLITRRKAGEHEAGSVFPDDAAVKKSVITKGSDSQLAATGERASRAEDAQTSSTTRETQGTHSHHTHPPDNVSRNPAPAFGQSAKEAVGIAGDQMIIDRSHEETAGVEALVLQHVSEFELLELHWRAERALLKQQHLQDLKDVAIDLYLLHKAALDGHDSPLILPALPSAQESDLLPADWHSHYRPDLEEAVAGLQQRDAEGGAYSRGSKTAGQVCSGGQVMLCSDWQRIKDEGNERIGDSARPAVPPLLSSSPVTTLSEGTAVRPTKATSNEEAIVFKNGSRVVGTAADLGLATGTSVLERNLSFRPRPWQRQPHTPHPVLDIVTPTSLLRRLIEHRRRQHRDRRTEGRKRLEDGRQVESQGAPVSYSRSSDALPPLSRRNSYSDMGAAPASVSRGPSARQSQSSTSVVTPGKRPALPSSHKGDGEKPSRRTLAEEPFIFPSVVDIDALLSPSAWEEGLRAWPEEQLLMRLRQHAVLPLMFGQQRKRSFVIRICTGNVTDIAEQASSTSAAGGQGYSGAVASGFGERTPKKPDDSGHPSGAGAPIRDRPEHPCGARADYLCGMTAAYDYQATECPSRANFFWVDSVRSPFYARQYCSDDALGCGAPGSVVGAMTRRRESFPSTPNSRGQTSGVDHAAGDAVTSSVTAARSAPSNVPENPTPLSSSPYAGQAAARGRASKPAATEGEDLRGGHPATGAGNGCSSSFSLVGPTHSPLVAIVLPVAGSVKLHAPAYQQWRARTAAASDFVFPGIDEQHRMLDVHLSRRKAALLTERRFSGVLSQQDNVAEGAGEQGGALSAHTAFPPALDVGEIFVSRHSNNGGVSVVFHLVVSGTANSSGSGGGRVDVSPPRSHRNVAHRTGASLPSTRGIDPTMQTSGVESKGVGESRRGESALTTSVAEPGKWDARGGASVSADEQSGLSLASLREGTLGVNEVDVTSQWASASVIEHEASLSCELQWGLKEILDVSSTAGIRTLVMPLLLMEGGAADCSLPFALLQRRVFQVLRCVINGLRSLADSSDCTPQLRQVVLVLPQQSQQHETGKGVARGGDAVGDAGGEWKAQDQRWIDDILNSAINFIRNSTHCCTLLK